jgi:hypothetical protein
MNDRIIITGDIDRISGETNPFESVRNLVAFDSRDWGATKSDAWLYGIVAGWDSDDDEPDGDGAMDELAARFGWDANEVARLRLLHKTWEEAIGS